MRRSQKSECVISPHLGADLSERVRSSTGLSYDSAQLAVSVVLSHLRDTLPAVGAVMSDVLDTMSKKKVG